MFTDSKNERLWQNCPDIVLVGVRATIIGCAEGVIEGEVKEGNNRIRYRWRLKAEKFGMAHALQSIMKVFWWMRKQIKEKVVDELMGKYGDKINVIHHHPFTNYMKVLNLLRLRDDLLHIFCMNME